MKYCPGEQQVIADMLSRAPGKKDLPIDLGTEQVFQLKEWTRRADEIDAVNPEDHSHVGDAKLELIREACKTDSEIRALMEIATIGWPETKDELEDRVKKYWTFRDEICSYNGIPYRGERIIIPASMRRQVLQGLHRSHQGIEGTLRRARDSVYWPGISAEIKQTVTNCQPCQETRDNQCKETLRSHAIPERPWAKIGMDLFQAKNQEHYVILVDYYSDYFEINKLNDLEAATVIRATKEQFARHGVPDLVQSDGGPQFISESFKRFAKEWGFQHTMSSPYHSQSNGKAESAVKIAKSILTKADDPYMALLEWRNTPSVVVNCSPVQRIFSRRTRSLVPQSIKSLLPQTVNSTQVLSLKTKNTEKTQQRYNSGAKDLPSIKVGQPVYVQDLRKFAKGRWNPGKVLDRCSDRSYIVETGGNRLRRNRKYLRPATSKMVDQTTSPGCERSERTDQTVAELPALSCVRGERADHILPVADPPAQICDQNPSCEWSERTASETAVAKLPAPGRSQKQGQSSDKTNTTYSSKLKSRMITTSSGRVSRPPDYLRNYTE